MKYDFNDVDTLCQVRNALMQLMNEIDIELYSFSGFEKDVVPFFSQLHDKILDYTKSERFSLLKDYFFQTCRDSAFEPIDSTVLNYINYLAKKRYSRKLLHVSDKTAATTVVEVSLRRTLHRAEIEYDYINNQYFV